MKLFVKERILLLNILPKEGNAITLRIVKGFAEDIGLSADEIEKYSVVTDVESGMVNWNRDADDGKDIEFSAAARGIITDAWKKLDNEKKLTLDMLPLHERFMLEPAKET